MKNFRQKLAIIGALVVLAACTCATPLVVSEIQKSDKKLTCKDVILEINEAEHYKTLAKKERGIGFGNALMPVCWATSYVDAAKASDAANARIAYLGKIYDVLDCGGKSDKMSSADTIPPPFMKVRPGSPEQSMGRSYAPLQPQSQAKASDNNEDDDENTSAVAAASAGVGGEKDVDDQMVRKDAHQHIDKFGKVYTHSHPYAGPHRHAEDK